MGCPSSFAIVIFGVITLATIGNIQAALVPLGMEDGRIKRSQIQATGITANDPKLDNLRHDCCKGKTGTEGGLCMASTGSFPKTITITLNSIVNVGRVKIQAPNDPRVGFVVKAEIWYKATATGTMIQYGTIAFDAFAFINKWAIFYMYNLPKVHTLEIRIASAADFITKPCLRLELYGCSSSGCPVIISEDPVLDTIQDVNNYVTFRCKMTPRAGHNHTATWYLNGTQIGIPKSSSSQVISVLPQKELYSSLTGTQLIQGLKCSVTVCDQINCAKSMSDPRVSNILSDTATISHSALKLTEGGAGQDVTIRLNGPPVLFFENYYLNDHHTKYVRIEAGFELGPSNTCGRQAIVLVVKNNEQECGAVVTDWTQQHILKIKVTIDGILDNSIVRDAFINIGHYNSPNYMVFPRPIGKIRVTKINNDGRGKVCYCYGDPHCQTSDGVSYEAHHEGDFILYRNKERNYQVNALFTNCAPVGGKVSQLTRTCGVAIKADDEVVVFSNCPRASKQPTFFNSYLLLHQDPSSLNGKLPSGMQIYSNSDGTTHRVRFPTGTYVRVRAERDATANVQKSRLSVMVVPSLSDQYKSDGACGNYDESAVNDFTKPDRSILPTSQKDTFMTYWRDNRSCSFFFGADKIQPANKQSFCTCGQGSKVLDCGENKDMDPCSPFGMEDVTNQFIRYASNRPRESCKPTNDDGIYDSFIFNSSNVATDPTWPTRSGWTKAKARTHCEEYLLKNLAVKNCQLLLGSNFPERIGNCIIDIKVTDGTTFSKATLNNIKAECLAVVEQYPLTKTFPGGLTRSDILNSLCDDDCNKNGVCKEGVCACNAGYYGSACLLTKDKPPVISYIARDGLCNLRVKNCTRSQIFGMGHINSTDLKCRITPYNYETGVHDDKGAFTTSAIYINFNMLICPHNSKNGTFLVAVSNNNGKEYSKDELMFLSYDSVCQKCTIDQQNKRGSCTQLDTGCTIEKACYKHGDVDPKNICIYWCDTTKNINYWSLNMGLGKYNIFRCLAIFAGVMGGVLVLSIIIVTVVVCKCCRRKKSVGPSVENIQEEAIKDSTSAEGRKKSVGPSVENIQEEAIKDSTSAILLAEGRKKSVGPSVENIQEEAIKDSTSAEDRKKSVGSFVENIQEEAINDSTSAEDRKKFVGSSVENIQEEASNDSTSAKDRKKSVGPSVENIQEEASKDSTSAILLAEGRKKSVGPSVENIQEEAIKDSTSAEDRKKSVGSFVENIQEEAINDSTSAEDRKKFVGSSVENIQEEASNDSTSAKDRKKSVGPSVENIQEEASKDSTSAEDRKKSAWPSVENIQEEASKDQ